MDNIAERIWQTRKIRINSESRLKANALIIEILIPYYSLNFIVITLIPAAEGSSWTTFSSVVGSLIILITSILASNFDFKTRSVLMKNHYIKLSSLYSSCLSSSSETEKEQINKEYLNELQNVENQSDIDYLKTIIEMSNDDKANFKKPTKTQYFKYGSHYISKCLLITILFSIPIVIDLVVCLT